jgi:hypothetical protein
LGLTIFMYMYWRIYVFTMYVLYTVVFESKSLVDSVACVPGECTWLEVPERAPFVLCLLVILVINCISIYRLCRQGLRLYSARCHNK